MARAALLLGLALALALPGAAFGGRPKIVQQDGRFALYDNGVVLDGDTGLEWVAGPDKGTSWEEASAWVDGLAVAGGGWRLPTRKELKSLFQDKRGTRNMTPLLVTNGWSVWSGDSDNPAEAWAYCFYFGYQQRFGRDGFDCNNRAFAVRHRKTPEPVIDTRP